VSRSSEELRTRLEGLFAFPVTPFTNKNEIDLPRYREQLQFLIAARPAALFVCGGTGEFYSLDLREYEALVKSGVEEAQGRLPVIAGVGYGTKLAGDFVAIAEHAKTDGLLVMPPYLIQPEQEGLYQHYSRIAASTSLPIIIYQRDNAIFAPETVGRLAQIANIVGFKDGYGDMERLLRIRLTVGARLAFMNGMPTAELSAPAFLGMGVSSYSSAVLNFVPQIATAFYDSLRNGQDSLQERLLNEFYLPFAQLRDRARGYAVSLIKAGLKVVGKPAGQVRPPLVNPPEEVEQMLRSIIQRGQSILKANR
jgi:5-dehydro-4-deoxyglucarate dehydratase